MLGLRANGKAGWLVTLLSVTGLVCGLTTVAQAEYKPRASAPPLVLSPDLSGPWVMQVPKSQAKALKNVRRSTKRKQSRAVSNRYNRRIPKQFLPTTLNYNTSHSPGTVIIDTTTRFLYLVQNNGRARRYGVGVGRPGFEWAGVHKVTRKREWPDWRPPAEMIKRQPSLPRYMPGGPRNPLGARALYLGSTLYRIHGSNEPWTIGQAVSSGCIRMRNEDVAELYKMVPIGAKVYVR
ncbi:L,D-transpeptidase [Pseudovibrio sp. Tun.PSC04-5.I4]|uniref:L,D-transpeptidase n=1 Tax=Pseudovibrio sp. Tun.PSC04-5.I4 TaxID=1798213 RepID=UPI0008922198|nr:L,D-transpeptidase [Pseudovibrio sp. Tun.PSC04-5.I4]SDQ78100.1 Lipoprotein-anchoring transpeptidase ErfK/SrfK [Pseudovibrio sp. Tun.PSC04-5.I4]